MHISIPKIFRYLRVCLSDSPSLWSLEHVTSRVSRASLEQRMLRYVHIFFFVFFLSLVHFLRLVFCNVYLSSLDTYYGVYDTPNVLAAYENYQLSQRYINADLKICQHLCLHLKQICWRFPIWTSFTFWDLRAWYMWKVCLQTFKTIEYVKN